MGSFREKATKRPIFGQYAGAGNMPTLQGGIILITSRLSPFSKMPVVECSNAMPENAKRSPVAHGNLLHHLRPNGYHSRSK
ncbi:hypothetical protein O1611_g3072 [Lasiodiplodia mahajangana]|uniref:Uncharacterized protein n=1 Tax=Lasiodiplodia mahajangana TaxID=1108764 RepID=A0ACC2JTG7_9PEZI|nr:hypothetical protein O1611_g3072 [Lasiodiplodia mahajangana]